MHGVFCRLRFRNQGHAMAIKGLADLGQGKLARGAVAQAHPQLRFQPANAPAQLGALHTERLGCSGIAASIDDLGEKDKVIASIPPPSKDEALQVVGSDLPVQV